mmetsp:Transcript_42182/g.104537  ORF Transcript_42182/g.104537 Transcript_42182/m.104537 type:complete len:290 (-) Transcript_42182:70-939(-)
MASTSASEPSVKAVVSHIRSNVEQSECTVSAPLGGRDVLPAAAVRAPLVLESERKRSRHRSSGSSSSALESESTRPESRPCTTCLSCVSLSVSRSMRWLSSKAAWLCPLSLSTSARCSVCPRTARESSLFMNAAQRQSRAHAPCICSSSASMSRRASATGPAEGATAARSDGASASLAEAAGHSCSRIAQAAARPRFLLAGSTAVSILRTRMESSSPRRPREMPSASRARRPKTAKRRRVCARLSTSRWSSCVPSSAACGLSASSSLRVSPDHSHDNDGDGKKEKVMNE